MKKTLIVYNFYNHHLMMEHLLRLVVNKGCEVDLLCTSNLKFIRESSVILSGFWNIYLNFFIKIINYLPYSISSYLNQKVFVRWFFRGISKRYDLVDFHSIPSYVDWLILLCIKNEIPYEVAFWGADIIHASEDRKKEIQIILDSCERIKCTKNLYDILHSNYGEKYKPKYREAYFGNVGLGYLNDITEEEKENKAIELLGDVGGKIVVTCGYNAIEVQNHELMINALNQLPTTYKNKIFVVFPMTYGKNEGYLIRMKQLLNKCDFHSIVLDNYLDNKLLSALRWRTNIMVMAQETDAFSGSVQEHLYCQNVVLIGEWLDYPLLKRSSVYYVPFSKSNLSMKLRDVLNNFNDYKIKCIGNNSLIYSIVSWETRINDWLPTYLLQ